MPMTDSEKLKLFTNTVISSAEQQAAAIYEKSEKERKKALDSELRSVLSDAHNYIYNSISETRRDNLAKISKNKLDNQKKYLLSFDKLISDIETRVIEKTTHFTETKKYVSFLIDSVKNSVSENEGRYTLVLSEKDYDKYSSELTEAGIDGIENIKSDSDIQIGGFRLVSLNNKKIIDETLDEKIKTKIEEFTFIIGEYIKPEEI